MNQEEAKQHIVDAVGLALAVILRIYRSRGTANVDEVDQLKW